MAVVTARQLCLRLLHLSRRRQFGGLLAAAGFSSLAWSVELSPAQCKAEKIERWQRVLSGAHNEQAEGDGGPCSFVKETTNIKHTSNTNTNNKDNGKDSRSNSESSSAVHPQVFVPWLPSQTWQTVLAACDVITRAGWQPVPHIAVRRLRDPEDWRQLYLALQQRGLSSALLVAGDHISPALRESQPNQDRFAHEHRAVFAEVQDLLSLSSNWPTMSAATGLRAFNVFFAGHPEGNTSADSQLTVERGLAILQRKVVFCWKINSAREQQAFSERMPQQATQQQQQQHQHHHHHHQQQKQQQQQQQLLPGIVTQLCFDATATHRFVRRCRQFFGPTVPIRIGVPPPLRWSTLNRMAAALGVHPPHRSLLQNSDHDADCLNAQGHELAGSDAVVDVTTALLHQLKALGTLDEANIALHLFVLGAGDAAFHWLRGVRGGRQ